MITGFSRLDIFGGLRNWNDETSLKSQTSGFDPQSRHHDTKTLTANQTATMTLMSLVSMIHKGSEGMSRSIEQLDKKEKELLVKCILDKKKGLNDTDWCDIVSDFQLDVSSETLRKAGVGVKMAEDAGMVFSAGGENTRSAMDGYVERQKLYDLQRDIRKDLRELSRSELIREAIRDAIRDMPKIEIGDVDDVQKDGTAKKTLLVGIGDFHYGACFNVYGLHGEIINHYSTVAFENRMSRLIDEIRKIVDKEHPGDICVMNTGDALDGLLRASQISRLEYGVVESAMKLSEYMAQWLAALQRVTHLPVSYYAVRGNHGEIRPLGTKAGQFPEENMERIVMQYLFERFSEHCRISIGSSDAMASQVIDVCGYTFMLIHGQGDDIEKIARDHQTLYNQHIDVFICGHLHKSQTFTAGMSPWGNVLIERVPSLCGMDPYAQSRGYGAQAGATVILMEEGYGRRCVYPIIFQE